MLTKLFLDRGCYLGELTDRSILDRWTTKRLVLATLLEQERAR